MKIKSAVSVVLRLTIAIILLQTLYFKFTAHPDSVYIFSALGVEPWGRIGLGIVELITALLILYPKTQLYGVVVSLGIIIGAIGAHLWVIGLHIGNDGGGLFALALTVFACAISYLLLHVNDIQLACKRLSHA